MVWIINLFNSSLSLSFTTKIARIQNVNNSTIIIDVLDFEIIKTHFFLSNEIADWNEHDQ